MEIGSVAPPVEQIAMLSKGNGEEMQDSALTNGAAAENFGKGPNMETALTQESVHVSGNGYSIDANNPVSSASTSCGFKMEKPQMPGSLEMYESTQFFNLTSDMLLTQDSASEMQFHCCAQVYREKR